MNVLDRIVVVGYDESFEDDIVIALNGQEVMSLTSFHEINFEGVQDCTEGGKSDVRCNNINVTYGYAKQGFESEANKDGLNSPLILINIKSKPLIGKQYLVLSNFVAEFDPHEKHYDCSSNLFHACNKYLQFVLENTGHPSPDGTINILENFSEIRNILDLTCLPENKYEAPCFPHFDEGNNAMDGFSSFFAVRKTEYDEQAGTVLRLAITGYNKGSIDNLMTQKVIADTVHSVVGDVQASTDVVTSISHLLVEHSLCYEDLTGKPHSHLFVVDAHPNISIFDSLSTHSLLSVLEKHGNAMPLVAELASALFLTNGNDKAYHAFKHLEVLEMLPKENLTIYFANWCNSEFGSIYYNGKFLQFCLPTQKPFPGLVAVVNNLVMRDIMISAKKEGQMFSKSMEVLKNEGHGMSTMVGPKVLWTVANAGSDSLQFVTLGY
jgi:hypothetical protein